MQHGSKTFEPSMLHTHCHIANAVINLCKNLREY